MNKQITYEIHKDSVKCWLLDLFVDSAFFASFRFSSETMVKLAAETIVKEYLKNENTQK